VFTARSISWFIGYWQLDNLGRIPFLFVVPLAGDGSAHYECAPQEKNGFSYIPTWTDTMVGKVLQGVSAVQDV